MDATTVEHISKSLFGPQGLFKTHPTSVVATTHSRKESGIRTEPNLLEIADGQQPICFSTPTPSLHSKTERSLKPVGSRNSELGTDTRLAFGGTRRRAPALQRSPRVKAKIQPPMPELQRQLTLKPTLDASAATSRSIATTSRPLASCPQQYSLSSYSSAPPYLSFNVGKPRIMLRKSCTNTIEAVWLDQWSKANREEPNKNVGMYLGVYAAFGVAAVIAMIIGAW